MTHRAIFSASVAIVCIGLVIFLGVPAGTVARVARGSISGTVTDPSGSTLKGAQISLESQDVKVLSDQQGRFSVGNLVPGSYILRVTNAGFSTWTKTVDIGANEAVRFDAQLQSEFENPPLLITAGRRK